MNKLLFKLVLVASLIGITPVQAEKEFGNQKVPIEIGEGVNTITIPLVINDGWVVVQAVASKEKPTNKYGEIAVYRVQVFYPTEWGMASIQDHLTADGKWSGLYTLTFEPGGETPWKFSFVLNLKNPLSNFELDSDRDKAAKNDYIVELTKVFGKDAKNLTLSPSFGMVEWKPTDNKELHSLMGEKTPEEELLSIEKVKLPPQVGGQPPFVIEKVGMSWGIITRDDVKKLVSLDEISPYLLSIENSPIRVKEGYLRRTINPEFHGEYEASKAWLWLLEKNKTVINVVPLAYFIAVVKQ